MAVEVRDDDDRQRDNNKHQESQRSNLEERYQREEDKIEVGERQTKESLEETREEEEKDEMKEEEEESVREDEPKQQENEEAKHDVEVAPRRDVERETRKGKETIGSISEGSAGSNEQIVTPSKSIGEEEKNSKQDSASSSDVDNRTKQRLSDFDCTTASPVDMSCSSATIGKSSCTYICVLSVCELIFFSCHLAISNALSDMFLRPPNPSSDKRCLSPGEITLECNKQAEGENCAASSDTRPDETERIGIAS